MVSTSMKEPGSKLLQSNCSADLMMEPPIEETGNWVAFGRWGPNWRTAKGKPGTQLRLASHAGLTPARIAIVPRRRGLRLKKAPSRTFIVPQSQRDAVFNFSSNE